MRRRSTRHLPGSSAGGLRAIAYEHRQLAVVGAGGLFVTLLVAALEPSPAQAWILGLPSPGRVISGLLGGIGNVIGGTVGKLAVTAFDAIVHALFAPIAHFINTQLIGWLVAVPDYAPAGSHVAATEHTVLAMAGAALGAVATISIARYWAAGLAGNGGSALEGLARTIGAALLLPLWPWAFHAAVALANAASTGLLGSGSVTKASANLLAVGVGAGVGLGFLGVGLFLSIVMAVIASVLFLGLLMMKVVLAISTVLVFVGMPIAIVLSPAIRWIPRVVVRAFAVCLAVPLLWALCFAATGALLNDAVFLKGPSGFFDALLEPLVAIVLLWIMLALPTRLAQMAMLGAAGVGGGFVSRTVSYAAGSQLRETARQHLPGRGGASRGVEQPGSRPTDSRLAARLGAESMLAASKAAAGNGVGAVAGVAAGAASGTRRGGSDGGSNGSTGQRSGSLGGSASPGKLRAYSPPPLAGNAGAIAGSGGLQRPSWRQDDFDAEMLEASLREQHKPVSLEQAKQARETLPPATQAAVGALIADQGPRVRQHLAYQALGEWTPNEREAIRTLAAADPDVRAQAYSDGARSNVGFGETTQTSSVKGSSRSGAGGSTTVEPGKGSGVTGDGGTAARTPTDQPPSSDGEGS